jgi:small-conductance mechanosensitive channel
MRARFSLALLLLASAPAHAQAPASGVPVVIGTGQPATVTVWNREVVTLRAALGEVGPAERAERVRRRIEELPPGALASAVAVAPSEVAGARALLVMVGGRLVVGLFPQDVDPESGQTQEQLAAATASRLGEILRAQAEQRRLPAIARAVATSLGATVLLVIALVALGRLHRRAMPRAAVARRRVLLGMDTGPLIAALRRAALRLTVLAAAAVAIYLWLTFVLVQWPYTRPWGEGLGAYVAALLAGLAGGALRALPGLFAVLVIFLLTRLVAVAVTGMFQGVESGRLRVAWLDPDTARATRRIVMALVWIFAITVAYPYVPGSETGVFKGISVFVGLLLTLGSSGLVNQVMSGVLLVYSRALRPGDYVRLEDDVEGVVTQVGLLSTKLTNIRREEVTVPNAVLVGGSVTNFTRLAGTEGAVATTTLTIGYDVPWRQVHALLVRAARRTPGVRPEPPPRVLQRALSDFAVEYELHVSLDRPEQRRVVLSDLHAQILDAFNEFGVQILSPHFEAQPGEKVVVPPSRWRAAPADGDAARPGPEEAADGRH